MAYSKIELDSTLDTEVLDFVHGLVASSTVVVVVDVVVAAAVAAAAVVAVEEDGMLVDEHVE